MKIGIVGSRRRNIEEDFNLLLMRVESLIYDYFKRYLAVGYELGESLSSLQKRVSKYYPEVTIVTGDCKSGGDEFARKIAVFREFNLIVKYVNYPEPTTSTNYYDYVKAYYDRNEEIAKEDLDYLICLVAPDRKGGTENTIKHFKRLNKDWKQKLIII